MNMPEPPELLVGREMAYDAPESYVVAESGGKPLNTKLQVKRVRVCCVTDTLVICPRYTLSVTHVKIPLVKLILGYWASVMLQVMFEAWSAAAYSAYL